MNHYTEDELSEYALRRKAITDRQAVEQHLERCAECREALDLIESFDVALRDPLPWELADAMSLRHQVPPELLDQARAIAAADTHARALILPLAVSPIRFREACIGDDPRFYSLAVVRLLNNVANRTHEHQPQFGLLLADAALDICGKVPEIAKSKSACFLGTAWKERANALRYLGRFREAEAALDEAEKAFASDGRPEPFDLAIVSYVRATVYCQLERSHEAVVAARAAATTFWEYGDTLRHLSALLAEGLGYYCGDRDIEAVRLMERVADLANEAGEAGILSRALLNAANSYTRLRNYEKAAEYYARALELLRGLDAPTECARVSWAMAALNVEQGDFDAGLTALEASRMQLMQLGMANDAALATLDLVAALLAVGSWDRVPPLCRAISVTFSSEGVMRSAKVALAYLAESVSSGQATPDSVRRVRTYLERLSSHPHDEFQQIQ